MGGEVREELGSAFGGQDPRPATILSPAAPHPQPSHTRRRCIRLQECALLSLPARAAAASHLQTLPMVKYEP